MLSASVRTFCAVDSSFLICILAQAHTIYGVKDVRKPLPVVYGEVDTKFQNHFVCPHFDE